MGNCDNFLSFRCVKIKWKGKDIPNKKGFDGLFGKRTTIEQIRGGEMNWGIISLLLLSVAIAMQVYISKECADRGGISVYDHCFKKDAML